MAPSIIAPVGSGGRIIRPVVGAVVGTRGALARFVVGAFWHGCGFNWLIRRFADLRCRVLRRRHGFQLPGFASTTAAFCSAAPGFSSTIERSGEPVDASCDFLSLAGSHHQLPSSWVRSSEARSSAVTRLQYSFSRWILSRCVRRSSERAAAAVRSDPSRGLSSSTDIDLRSLMLLTLMIVVALVLSLRVGFEG